MENDALQSPTLVVARVEATAHCLIRIAELTAHIATLEARLAVLGKVEEMLCKSAPKFIRIRRSRSGKTFVTEFRGYRQDKSDRAVYLDDIFDALAALVDGREGE